MSRASSIGLLTLAFLVGSSLQAAADNAYLIVKFGGDPGAPLAHAYDYGVPEGESPTYRLRIPVIDVDLKKIFHDTVLTVASADQIVQTVSAARAYRSRGSREAARDVVLAKLAEGLPNEYAPADGEWQRQSADGKVIAAAVCAQRRHYPMPILRLTIALHP